MSVLVTDAGFQPDDWRGGFVPASALRHRPCAVGLGVDLAADADPTRLVRHFPAIALLRIRLPHFAAQDGFELAHRLRALGYSGRLRAEGHVLADQYTLARRAGFDEVEISAGLALRQPEEHWKFRGNWRHDAYGSRLRARSPGGIP
jgi:uncharacterized protein (DUF934 family)